MEEFNMNKKRILAGLLSLLMVYSVSGVYGNVFAEDDKPAFTLSGEAKSVIKELTEGTINCKIYSDSSMLIKGSGVLTDFFNEDDVKDITKLIIEDENESNRISIAPNALKKFHNVAELTLPTAGSELWAEFQPENINVLTESKFSRHHSKIAELFDYENSRCRNEITKYPFNSDIAESLKISNPFAWEQYKDEEYDKTYNAVLPDYKLNKIIITGGTSVTDFAFYNTTIESVYLPESVTDIGKHAFHYCTYLDDCELSSNIKYIGEMAFAFTSLGSASITNPDFIIEKGAFAGCGLLKELTFANLEPGHMDFNLYEIDNVLVNDDTFNDKEDISFIRSLFAKKVFGSSHNEDMMYRFTADDVFTNSWANRLNLEKITVLGGNQIAPYSLYSIPSLITISLPDTISVIGTHNFAYNQNLLKIEYAGSAEEWNEIVKVDGNDLPSDAEIYLSGESKTENQNHVNKITDLFDRNVEIKSISLGTNSFFAPYNTVIIEKKHPEEILKSEKKLNDTLSCRTYESGLMIISGYGLLEDVFDEEEAAAVTSLVIENKSENEKIKIADNALKKFKNIEELTLPSADKDLWNDFKPQTVSENENAQTVHCSLLGYLFNSEANISYDTKLSCIYDKDTDTFSFTSDLPESVDPDFSVMNDYKIKKITVSGGKEIADFAFFNIPVETVVLPETITNIGKSAFAECKNLEKFDIPDSVVFIDELAFASTAISEAKITNKDYIVAKGIFANCIKLKNLYLANLESGHMDLSGANKNNPEELSVVLSMFAGKTDTAFINNNSETIHKYDFSYYNIPNILTNLFIMGGKETDAYACYGMENLEKVGFAPSIRLIGKYSFGCEGRNQSNTKLMPYYYYTTHDICDYYHTVLEGNYFNGSMTINGSTNTPGDLSGNGIVDLTDLTILSLYLMKDDSYKNYIGHFSEVKKSAADVNCDDQVDIADLADLKRIVSHDFHANLGAERKNTFYSNANF